MANLSTAGVGMISFIVLAALRYFGIVAPEEQVAAFAVNLVQGITFIVWVWGQVRRQDLSYGIFRK